MKSLIVTLAVCLIVGFCSGCTQEGKDYVNEKVDKLQEIYENFDTESFGETVKSYLDSALKKGSEIVGDISQMSNEELAEKIKTALFGDGTSDENPGLGFDLSVAKKDVSEDKATVECTISLKIGVTVLEKTVGITLERNENGNWIISGFDLGLSK